MIIRDTARRAGGLVGFTLAQRAQVASAAATLAELVLKTNNPHTIQINGVTDGKQNEGLEITVETPWLEGASSNNVLMALQAKVGGLVDDIVIDTDPSKIILITWEK